MSLGYGEREQGGRESLLLAWNNGTSKGLTISLFFNLFNK